jgi:hypothetical protein
MFEPDDETSLGHTAESIHHVATDVKFFAISGRS